MTEGEHSRLIAWAHELRTVHTRLRDALDLVQQMTDDDVAPRVTSDLLVFCRGFCTALNTHHEGEDRHLFPAIAQAHPDLGETLRKLTQDHSMMSHLIAGLEDAAACSAGPAELRSHLEGLAAIMESHFRYEERALLGVLESLDLSADPGEVLGPL